MALSSSVYLQSSTTEQTDTNSLDIGGTTTPNKVTILEVTGIFRGVILKWDEQRTLTNFDHYEIQVSDDQVNWYSLKNDGTDWKDTLNGTTTVYVATYTHSRIPLGGTADNPQPVTLYYRVRRVTKVGATGDWSDVAAGVAQAIDSGELAADSVYTNNLRAGIVTAEKIGTGEVKADNIDAGAVTSEKIAAGELTAREFAIADDEGTPIYENDDATPSGGELYDLSQPDCVSSLNRFPEDKLIVYEPGEYGSVDNPNKKWAGRGIIGLFQAVTNFVATTDLDDATKWNINSNYHRDYGNVWDFEIEKTVWRWKRGLWKSATYVFDIDNAVDGTGTYTFSFWFKAEEDCYLRPGYFYGGGEEGSWRTITANTWTKIEETVTASTAPTGIQMCRIFGKKQARYIRDWVAGSTSNLGNHWIELKVLDYAGNNLASGITPTVQSGDTISNAAYVTDGDSSTVGNYATVTPADGNSHYVQIDLGSVKDIAYIQVWHYYGDGRTYHNTKTEISTDGVTWTAVFDSAIDGEYAETSSGHGISLYGHDKYLYATEPQIEKLAYATTFTPATRPYNKLYYRYNWQQQGAIEGWIKPRFNYDVTQHKYIISNHYGTSWQIIFYYNKSNDAFRFSITDGTNTVDLSSTQITSNTTLQQWTYFKIYWDTVNDNYGMIIKNSVLNDNKTSTTALNTITFNDYLEIGSIPLYTSPSGFQFDGYMTDFLIWSTADTSTTHYTNNRPYYDPNEIANSQRTVRISNRGIRLHNTALTITDKYNREIDISNSTGLLARDASGTIIHDIPDAVIQEGSAYCGHIIWSKEGSSSLDSLTMTPGAGYGSFGAYYYASTMQSVAVDTYGMENVKGVILRVRIYGAHGHPSSAGSHISVANMCHSVIFFGDSNGTYSWGKVGISNPGVEQYTTADLFKAYYDTPVFPMATVNGILYWKGYFYLIWFGSGKTVSADTVTFNIYQVGVII